MYRVLIVEDEMLVRLGLKNSINWEKYNMTIVADVSNGCEAWEIYEQEKPELVITDIKMPVMDGIELIKKIREKNLNTKIIILSCLEDFEIAIKAVSLGVSEYIPKLTMSSKDIEAVIKKVYVELTNQGFMNRNNLEKRVTANELKEKFLRDCLFDDIFTKKSMETDIENINIRLSPKRLLIIILEIDQYSAFNEKGSWVSTIILDTIVKVIEGNKNGEVLKDNDKRYIIMLSFSSISDDSSVFEQVSILTDQVRKILKNHIDIKISIGVSSIKNDYSNLKSCYNEAQEVSLFKLCYGLEQTFFWSEELHKKCQLEIADRVNKKKDLLFQDSFLSSTQFENIRIKLANLIEKRFKTVEDVYKMFFQLMYWNSVEMSYSYPKVSNMLLEFQIRITQCETLYELFDIYEIFVKKLKEIGNKKRLINKEVVQAVKYIQNSCETNYNLQQVAQHVGLSPNYLSSLFKKELDQSFIEYMNNIKVQRAKKLLIDSNLKIYEIAEKTGFSDESYFSRTFKKLTGKNPNNFRKTYFTNALEGFIKDEKI